MSILSSSFLIKPTLKINLPLIIGQSLELTSKNVIDFRKIFCNASRHLKHSKTYGAERCKNLRGRPIGINESTHSSSIQSPQKRNDEFSRIFSNNRNNVSFADSCNSPKINRIFTLKSKKKDQKA